MAQEKYSANKTKSWKNNTLGNWPASINKISELLAP